MDLKETYNYIAEDWHKDHLNDEWWKMGTEKFASLFKPSSHILDVGCAGGIKAKYFISRGLKASGIDLSEEMVKISQREVPEANFKAMDMRDVSSLDSTFDGIFVQASLLHIPKNEAPQVVNNLSEKLNSGGYFYIAVKEMKDDGVEEETVTEDDYGYEYKRFFSYYTLDEIKDYLTKAGMDIVWENVSSTGRSNWIQVIARK